MHRDNLSVHFTTYNYGVFIDHVNTSVSIYATFNPLNAQFNPICHLLALFGAHHILHVSRIRVNNSEMCYLVSFVA